MPLSSMQSEMLRTVYRRLDPTEALKPGDDRYEPIYGESGREDPVARLATRIRWSGVESLQLFSGFRGSGKTTELFRLRKELEDQGDVVIYANALEYLNPADPVGIVDLLLAVVGAFDEAVLELPGIAPTGGSYWERIRDFLDRVHVSEATLSGEADGPMKEIIGGLKAGLELKLALREAGSFRERLRQFLQNRLVELKNQANRLIEERVKAIRNSRGPDTQVVFVFDQMEQLRGSASTEAEVILSVERIFASHLDKLRFPLVHTIYTVPPWLQFVLPGGMEIEMLATFRLWKNDPARSELPEGLAAMRAMVLRRFGSDGVETVFGPGPEGELRLKQLILASGGHFRDLFRLLRELLVRLQTQQRSLPASTDSIDEAIQRVREQYLPISEEDARRLGAIERTRACVLTESSAQEATKASRLLDLHLVLYFSNGEDWYDIHPLVREEVERVIARNRAPSGG